MMVLWNGANHNASKIGERGFFCTMVGFFSRLNQSRKTVVKAMAPAGAIAFWCNDRYIRPIARGSHSDSPGQ